MRCVMEGNPNILQLFFTGVKNSDLPNGNQKSSKPSERHTCCFLFSNCKTDCKWTDGAYREQRELFNYATPLVIMLSL